MTQRYLNLFGVLRLGLVQTSLGAIVVLTTSTINRVMVVELALPALLPGLLVGLHYAIQITRPRMGYGSDTGGRRTPWILGGMLVLAIGGVLAAYSTLLIQSSTVAGIALAVVAFLMVGLGVGAAGTSLLVLLAKSVAPKYRGAAASTVWVMMILGFIITAIVAGKQLEPFSFERLVMVSAVVSALAFFVTSIALVGIEPAVPNVHEADGVKNNAHAVAPDASDNIAGSSMLSSAAAATTVATTVATATATATAAADTDTSVQTGSYRQAIHEVWAEPDARRFSVFVFVSMLAYSAQDLVLEPFAGAVFGMTPSESTQLSGTQHGGVLLGMLLVALLSSVIGGRYFGSLRRFTMAGCLASSMMLLILAVGGQAGAGFPIKAAVFALGLSNGVFAVAAIGSMMDLVGRGAKRREGVRMGLWGAAQAIAFGLGGIGATLAVDVSNVVLDDTGLAYGIVFLAQAVLFVWAAKLAFGVYQPAESEQLGKFTPGRIALEMER